MNETAKKILGVIDRAINGLESPQNAAKPSRAPASPEAARARGTVSENMARAIVAGTPPDPESPMDRTRLLPPPTPDALSGVPHPNPAQLAAFGKLAVEAGFEIPDEVRDELGKLDEVWTRLMGGFERFSDRRAREDHAADIAEMTRRVAAGQEVDESRSAWSKSDWAEDYAARRTALKQQCREIEKQARKLATPVYEDFGKVLDQIADDLDEQDRLRAERLSCPHRPSLTVWLMRKASESARQGSVPNNRPREMLGHIPVPV
jgi:hypothetical protein